LRLGEGVCPPFLAHIKLLSFRARRSEERNLAVRHAPCALRTARFLANARNDTVYGLPEISVAPGRGERAKTHRLRAAKCRIIDVDRAGRKEAGHEKRDRVHRWVGGSCRCVRGSPCSGGRLGRPRRPGRKSVPRAERRGRRGHPRGNVSAEEARDRHEHRGFRQARGEDAADLAAGARRAQELAARELAKTRAAVAVRRPKTEFDNTPVKDALQTLGDLGRFSIVIDPALEEAGVDLAARTVTFKAHGSCRMRMR